MYGSYQIPWLCTESGMLCPVFSLKLKQRKRKTLFLLLLCVLSTIERRRMSLDLLNSRNCGPTVWGLVKSTNMFFILHFYSGW